MPVVQFLNSCFRGLVALSLVGTVSLSAGGSIPVFAHNGQLIRSADTGETTALRLKSHTGTISAVWGSLADGSAVITIGPHLEKDEDAVEGHSHDHAGPLALMDSSGATPRVIIPDRILRAFVSPGGKSLIGITPDRDGIIWREDGTTLPVQVPGRVSHASWSPAADKIAVAVYPPDWSPGAVDNARNPERFLALQNSDIYLVDAATGTVLSHVTTDPGTEYNPFFSPAGNELYYIGLHATENQGGLMRVNLDSPGALPVAVTQAGSDPPSVPLGRVGTYCFVRGGSTIVFEAGLPDGAGEIWSMTTAGSNATRIGPGRHPQLITDGEVAVIDGSVVKRLVIEAVR